MFHYRCKYKSGYKRNGQRIGHGLIMFVESIFKDIQLHGLIEVLEEDFAQVVAFADDDGILRVQVAEAGKGGAEHGVGGHVAEAAFIVELFQSGLY